MKLEVMSMHKFITYTLLICLFLFCSGIQVQAIPMESEQQKVEMSYEEPHEVETPNVFWMIVQMILALGLILFLAWGLIRFFGGNLRGRLQGRYIRVLDEVTLGPNRGMVVIEVGGKAFLVGVTDHQISMLGELDDSQMIEDMIAASLENIHASPNNPAKVWSNVKDQLLSGLHKKKPTQGFEAMVDQKMQTLEKMSHRLRNLNNDNLKDDGWKK